MLLSSASRRAAFGLGAALQYRAGAGGERRALLRIDDVDRLARLFVADDQVARAVNHDRAFAEREAGLFEQVWCLTPDRLVRSYAYQILVTDEFARHGVPVLYLDAPPLKDDSEATLLVQVQGMIAEYERAKIAERNRRGRLYRARAGEIVYHRVPYGYRRIPRSPSGPSHLEIYEPEAVVVRRIL